MRDFVQDMHLSLRALRKNLGFSLVAITTLAIGIAGTTVIFSIINAVMLHPLPYPGSDRLVVVYWQSQNDLTASAFFMLKDRARSFSSVAAIYAEDIGVNMAGDGTPQYVRALRVSKEFFQTMGIFPEIGNPFRAEDDQPDAPHTVVLSHDLWVRAFNKGPSAEDRELRINGNAYKIIGIMPQGFRSYPEADIWLPLQLSRSTTDAENDYRVVARLANGISRQQAQHELQSLSAEYRLTHLTSAKRGALVAQDLQVFLMSRARDGLMILFGAVLFVFLITCTNVTVLLMVRATASSQAVAIRATLGAGRGRLVQAFLADGLLLSLIGGLLGLILTKESLPFVLSMFPASLPLAAKISIDSRVLLFILALSVLGPLLFSVVPALKLTRLNLSQILAQRSHTASAGADETRTIHLLVSCQTVLTFVLLVGTSLLLKSLFNLYSVPLGLDPEQVIVAQISLADDRYRTTAHAANLAERILEQVRALPDVYSVAAINGLPLERGLNLPIRPNEIQGQIDQDDQYRIITPAYFTTLRIPLRSGREFLPSDASGSAPVAIINEAMARQWWPDTSPIGHFVTVNAEIGPQFADQPRQIVGVVADVRELGPDQSPSPTLFVPLGQAPDNITAFVNKVFLTSIAIRIRGRTAPSAQIRNAVQSVEPDLPLASCRTFSQIIDVSLARQRFISSLTSGFGAFALLLTAIGIYGLLSYQVGLRTREIAIRIAVGARRGQIIAMIVRQHARMISISLLVGLALSFMMKSLLETLLYNVQRSLVMVIAGMGVLLGLLAALISLITAIRAASVEPAVVLKNE